MTMKIRDRNDFDESGKNNFSSYHRCISSKKEKDNWFVEGTTKIESIIFEDSCRIYFDTFPLFPFVAAEGS